ncbi:PIG-L deacetylase family protein [Streptomyces sp. NPDC096097]|uniref:PIG-L deacetylase family protein n=1 Tax=Streptomyces sp. NPDC096097 TaxID=3155546 RepID=UPI0033193594
MDLVERVLVVVAHPDDVDFAAAGTVAGWCAEGKQVWYCVVTDGDAGGNDQSVGREEIRQLRRAEQVKAAAAVGVAGERIRWLGYSDGCLELSLALRRDIARVIRHVRPHLVLTQSPERDWGWLAPSHPDHLVTGEATFRAVYPDARNPFAFPELRTDERLEPWVVPEVWLSCGPRPNRFVDVTESFEAKMRALMSHASQIGDAASVEAEMRQWLGRQAETAGLPAGRLAEPFQVVSTRG